MVFDKMVRSTLLFLEPFQISSSCESNSENLCASAIAWPLVLWPSMILCGRIVYFSWRKGNSYFLLQVMSLSQYLCKIKTLRKVYSGPNDYLHRESIAKRHWIEFFIISLLRGNVLITSLPCYSVCIECFLRKFELNWIWYFKLCRATSDWSTLIN